ncbi:MAG: DUF1836 domain-containing protein [Clostridia bacterium]|nr:DUF1836 domain-containing protein [Clostridia bacterium]
MNEQLRALLAEAIRDANLHSQDIPAIDLYLDQIMNLVADAQGKGAAHFAERQLTKTMINNYSKDGLIMPVKGKKYTREHIVQMLLVYSLKNTLSMTEIKRILCDVYDKDVPLIDCYDGYLATKPDDRELCLAAVDTVISRHSYDMESDADYFKALLELCTLSDYFRCMAQAMLLSRYPDPEEKLQQEKDEKQQQKSAAKQQKKAAKAAAAADEPEKSGEEEQA